jgi:hypothetical protein
VLAQNRCGLLLRGLSGSSSAFADSRFSLKRLPTILAGGPTAIAALPANNAQVILKIVPPMKEQPRFRVATYNTHKCRGIDGRIRPSRVAEVLNELGADVIALQEVVSLKGARTEQDQAQYLADAAGYDYRIGETRKLRGAVYGNVILSRFPVREVRVYDLTASRREARGCIRCDLEIAPGKILHLFNVHLGTGYMERRKQARLLMSREVLLSPQLKHPRLIIGDFNEWILTTCILIVTWRWKNFCSTAAAWPCWRLTICRW